MPTPLERFMPKVRVTDGCWIWTAASVPLGYGRFYVDGRLRPAHAFSYETLVGPIPDGLHTLHRCDVPACVRPDHLFLGTHAENMADMAAKGRANPNPTNGLAACRDLKLSKTHCKHGHLYDEENTGRFPNGGRRCRQCSREQSLAGYHRRKKQQ